MPSSAAATGLVDDVIPIKDMPKRLLAYQQHLASMGAQSKPDRGHRDVTAHIGKISAVVRRTLGHDFGEYKQSTLVRRIQRRMLVRQLHDAAAYVECLEKDRHEVERLFQDLLIGVTSFFRDQGAFASFATVLREIMKGR